MRIVLSGGGTAGHINPALALADELQQRGHEVFYAGTPCGIEKRLAQEAGLPFQEFEAQGFDRSNPKSLIPALSKMSKSTKQARAWFKELKPDAVVAFGGYVCIPVGRAAMSGNIPLIVHEQNSVMGLANKYLSKHAQAVALTYDNAAESVAKKDKVITVGNPVRSSVLKATKAEGRAKFEMDENALCLLVFGGSLGAQHLNTACVQLKDTLLSYENLEIIHITGPKEFDRVTNLLNLTEQEAKRWHLISYDDDMGRTLAAADIVVSRAGATSLAEITARKIPALLVPYPYATGDHQTANAHSCVEAGSAFLVADADVEKDIFKKRLCEIIENDELRKDMQEAAKGFGTESASRRLADVVCAVVEHKQSLK